MNERTIFLEALELPDPDAAREFLDDACGDDGELRAKVEELLRAHHDAGSFLESRPPELAPTVATAGPASDSLPPLAPAAGTKVRYFGDYELREEIARGGMGVVYKARQTRLNRDVALKMILAGKLAGPDDVKRFYAEAEAAARLNHPNIVPIFEVGQHEGQHYFSMGFVAGDSLADRIAQGPLEPNAAAELTRTIAEAVAYAHGQGVIHRDLKPGNILLDADSRPHVTDFGLAKRTEDDSGITHSGQILGTPSYMPPEQAAGVIDAVAPAADIYALGANLYCLLTGRPPFQAANPVDTLRQVLHNEPPSPREINPTVPRDLETICVKCLQKETRRRYESAQDLADDLGRYLRGEPIHARPVGRLERGVKWVRRRPLVAALTAAVALSLLVGTTVSTFFAVQANRRAEAEQEQREIAQQREGEAIEAQDAEAAARKLAEQREAEAKDAEGRAVAQRNRAIRNLYVAHAYQHQRAWENNNYGRLHVLLNRWETAPSDDDEPPLPDPRGFEWYYLRTQCDEAMTILGGYKAALTSVAWRPDGKRIATGDHSGYVTVWDAETEQKLFERKAHASASYSVAWSPDGNLLASASADHTVILWNAETGEVLHRIDAHSDEAWGVDFAPDGRLASVGDDGMLRIWNAETGEKLHEMVVQEGNKSRAVVWSHDGTLVATKGPNGVHIWDAETWGLQRHFSTGNYTGAIAWSPDDRHFVTTGTGLAIWDVATGKRIHWRREYLGARCVSWSTGNEIASGGNQQVTEIWDPVSGELKRRLGIHGSGVIGLAFSPDGTRIASGGEEGDLRVYASSTQHEQAATCSLEAGCIGLAWCNADRQLIAVAGNRTLAAFNPVGELSWRRELTKGFGPRHVVRSPDGRRLAILDYKGRVRLFDTLQGDLISEIDTGLENPRELTFNNDGKQIASIENQTLCVWNVVTGKLLVQFTISNTHVGNPVLDWRPHHNQIAVKRGHSATSVFDLDREERVRTYFARRTVSQIKYSPDGNLLATATASGEIFIEDERTGEHLTTLTGHTNTIDALAWTHNGRRLASGSHDNTVRIWDVETGEPVLVLRGHAAPVKSVAWNQSATRLASGDSTGVIHIWSEARDVYERDYLPYGELTPIDLQSAANHRHTEAGDETIGGVAYRIGPQVIRLQGANQAAEVSCDRPFATLHMLYAATSAHRDDRPVVECRVHYANEMMETFPVIVSQTPVDRRQDWRHATWSNPHPRETVATIEFVALQADAVYDCIALTAEGHSSTDWLARATAHHAAQDWERAIDAYGGMIETASNPWPAVTIRASLYGGLHRWQPAGDDYVRLLEAPPGEIDSDMTWLQGSFVLAYLGRRDEYRELCRRALTWLDETGGEFADERIAKACLALPGETIDSERIVELTTAALAKNANSGWLRMTHALALLRSGRYADAAELVETVRRDGSPLGIAARLIFAIVQHHLGDDLKARTAYYRADDHLKKALASPAGAFDNGWHNHLFGLLLRREAAALLEIEQTATPADDADLDQSTSPM